MALPVVREGSGVLVSVTIRASLPLARHTVSAH